MEPDWREIEITDVNVDWETHPRSLTQQNGSENMNKLYQALILDKVTGIVTGESYVTAKNKEQAFAKVDTSDHSLDDIKVFLNKIGEYKPKE